MFYFFPHTTNMLPIIQNSGLTQVSATRRVFKRDYINSNTYLELTQDPAEYKIWIDQDPHDITQCVYEGLCKEARITLEGVQEFAAPTGIVFTLTKPWKVKVIDNVEPIQGLTQYPKGLAEYFYQRKIGIFSGPGSGKTCLARRLANHLSIEMGASADAPYEYVSTFISRYGPPTFLDEIWLLLKQWEREDDITKTKDITISDCPYPLMYIYGKMTAVASGHGTDKSLPWLQEISLKGLHSFDTKIFLPFKGERCVQDGIRLHNPNQGKEITDQIKQFLDETGSEYIVYKDDFPGLLREIFYFNR